MCDLSLFCRLWCGDYTSAAFALLAQPLSIVRQGFDVVAVKIILELLPGDSVLADSHQEVVVSLAVYYTSI